MLWPVAMMEMVVRIHHLQVVNSVVSTRWMVINSNYDLFISYIYSFIMIYCVYYFFIIIEAVPSRRRGKAKNLALTPTWEANGKRPLPLEFDDITATTVGPIHDLFIREVGGYIERDISLDRGSWKKVSPAEKNAMYEHLMVSYLYNYI